MIKGFDKKKYDRHQVPVIRAIILVRDGSITPHAPLAQRTDQIDWNTIELKEYKAQATRCTGLLFKPGDAKIEKIEK